MEEEFKKIKEEIQEFINKYDINEFKVDIFKLYKEKIINIRVDKNVK